MSEDASPASASASAPEVATACMNEEARSTTGKQDRSEASRNDALAPVGGDVYRPQHQQVAFDVCGGQGGVLDLRMHDVQGVPHQEAVCQDERHARLVVLCKSSSVIYWHNN